MIKITNGQMTLTVPNSAFLTIYKASGFHILDTDENVSIPADTFPTYEEKTPEGQIYDEEKEALEESDNDETEYEEEVDLSEIPLSEMDFYQLESYADQLGLDHRGIRSKKELRALIRNNI